MPTSSLPSRARSVAALGRAVRRERENRGLTQAELAERSGTTRYAIVLLESGHTTKALELVFRVLATLGLELVVRPRQDPDGAVGAIDA